MQIYTTKTEAYVSFERNPVTGFYNVRGYDDNGNLFDKVSCDTRSDAIAYRNAFIKIAKQF